MASRMANYIRYQQGRLSPEEFERWKATDVKVQSWLAKQERIPAAVRALDDLQKKILKNVIGPGLEKASEFLAGIEKQEAPVGAGTLRQAIGSTKVRLYPATFCGYIASGPRRGYARSVQIDVKRLIKGKIRLKRLSKAASALAPKSTLQNPVAYARYLMRGRKAMIAGPGQKAMLIRANGFFGFRRGVKASPARDFMKGAEAQGDQAAAKAAEEMNTRIENLLPGG
jgi:hypothetical protein